MENDKKSNKYNDLYDLTVAKRIHRVLPGLLHSGSDQSVGGKNTLITPFLLALCVQPDKKDIHGTGVNLLIGKSVYRSPTT